MLIKPPLPVRNSSGVRYINLLCVIISMNSRLVSATHMLPKHPAEKYLPPRGNWKIMGIDKPTARGSWPVLLDPRMDSGKLEDSLWKSELARRKMLAQAPGRFRGSAPSPIFESLMEGEGRAAFPNAKCPKDVAESLLRDGSRGMPKGLLKEAFNVATLGLGASPYEHMLYGSTGSQMCEPFLPTIVSTGIFSVSEIAMLREMGSPMGTYMLSFLRPVEEIMPKESREGIVAITGAYASRLSGSGRMADYPEITGLEVMLDSLKTVTIESPEVLSMVATPRVRIDKYYGCAWIYDYGKCLRAVKLEE